MTHRVHVRSTHFQEGAGPVPVTRLLWFHIFSREVFSLCLTSWRGSAGWLAGVDQPSDRTALRPHARGRGHKFTSPPSSFCKAQPPLPMISESFLLSFIVPHALRSSSSYHLWSAHQHQIFHPPFSGGGFLPLYLASLCLRMLPQSASPKQTNPTSSYVEAQTVDTEPAFGLKFPVFIPLVSGENVCFICCLCVSAEHKQWLLFDPLSDLEYIRDPPTQPSAPPRGRSVPRQRHLCCDRCPQSSCSPTSANTKPCCAKENNVLPSCKTQSISGSARTASTVQCGVVGATWFSHQRGKVGGGWNLSLVLPLQL